MDTKEKEQLKKVITNDNIIKKCVAEFTKNQQCKETKPISSQLHYSNYIWDMDEYLDSPLNE